MTELFKAVFWFTFGAVAMVLFLAWPIALPDDDMLAIQAFRDMGCEPHYTESKALVSGCEKVKAVRLEFGK